VAPAVAVLDDTYLTGSPAAAVADMTNFRSVMAELGPKVNDSKTKVWVPDPSHELPQSFQAKRVSSPPCVEAVAPYARPGWPYVEAD